MFERGELDAAERLAVARLPVDQRPAGVEAVHPRRARDERVRRAHERAGAAVRRSPRAPGAQLRAQQGRTSSSCSAARAASRTGSCRRGCSAATTRSRPTRTIRPRRARCSPRPGYPDGFDDRLRDHDRRRGRAARRSLQAISPRSACACRSAMMSFATYVAAIGQPRRPGVLDRLVGRATTRIRRTSSTCSSRLAHDRERELEERLVLRQSRARHAARCRARRDRRRRSAPRCITAPSTSSTTTRRGSGTTTR